MTRSEIAAFFPLGTRINYGGTAYAVPTLAWLTGPFWGFFKSRLWSDALDAWEVRWECRDFARAYACYAQECNALSPGQPPAEDALAVGEFWYHPTGSAQDHAINACITDRGLVFVDPQNGLTVNPTTNELNSCAFCRF